MYRMKCARRYFAGHYAALNPSITKERCAAAFGIKAHTDKEVYGEVSTIPRWDEANIGISGSSNSLTSKFGAPKFLFNSNFLDMMGYSSVYDLKSGTSSSIKYGLFVHFFLFFRAFSGVFSHFLFFRFLNCFSYFVSFLEAFSGVFFFTLLFDN